MNHQFSEAVEYHREMKDGAEEALRHTDPLDIRNKGEETLAHSHYQLKLIEFVNIHEFDSCSVPYPDAPYETSLKEWLNKKTIR